MIKITVEGGLHRSLQRRVDSSLGHLHDKTRASTKQVDAHIRFAFHTSKPIALSNLEKWPQTATIIKRPTASNRTLLEKISGVCITLLSLHINISQFTLKMLLFWRKKASDVQCSRTANRLQRSIYCMWRYERKRDSCNKALYRLLKPSSALANIIKHAHD